MQEWEGHEKKLESKVQAEAGQSVAHQGLREGWEGFSPGRLGDDVALAPCSCIRGVMNAFGNTRAAATCLLPASAPQDGLSFVRVREDVLTTGAAPVVRGKWTRAGRCPSLGEPSAAVAGGHLCSITVKG